MMEHYGFTWPGKHEAILEAGRPTDKILRPSIEDSVNFSETQNLYIEGDNLEAMKIMLKGYARKIKMIYIDPPYNTGHDFIYNDNFSQTEEEAREQFGLWDDIDAIRNFTVSHYRENSKSNPRYHSDWCSMMYPRLKIAQSLLADDGVIFISIDDNEVTRLRMMCDEIFGESNFVAQLIWKSKSGGANDSKFFAVDHEYILCYAKNTDSFILKKDIEAEVATSYNRRDDNGEYALERLDKQSIRHSDSLDFEIIGPDGQSYYPHHKNPAHPNARWRWSRETVMQRYDELVFENGNVYTKNYKKDGAVPRSLLTEERFGRTRTGKTDLSALFERDLFSSPKPYKLISHLIRIATDSDSIILDFFSGSSTTAHAVMNLNAQDLGSRKFIMIQLPEECSPDSEAYRAGYKTICDIGRERIKRAGNGLIGDTGFRVLRLDSSNFRDVFLSPESLTLDSLDSLADNLKHDRTGLDLLFGLVAEFGLPLSLPYRAENVDGFTLHHYGDGEIIACFDSGLTEHVITHIARLAPTRVVFRDSGFTDSRTRINFEQLLKYYAPASALIVI